MKLTSLNALYVEELKDLFSAEQHVLRALPRMAKLASAPRLRQAFADRLHQARVHIGRLDMMFLKLGVSPKGSPCHSMEMLVSEGRDLEGDEAEPMVMDAALIAASQRAGHYLIAGFGCARELARQLGHDGAVSLLQEMQDETIASDQRTTELTVAVIRPMAVVESSKS